MIETHASEGCSAVDLKAVDVVVDHSGQATIAIPIDVPPAIGGKKPKLELVYQSRAGNGSMGVGWSCSGFSAISRCRPNYAVDGFSAPISFSQTDRLALDGQRLMVVKGEYGAPGAHYETEIQSWKSVREKDGGFSAIDRNGETTEFGMTPDSRILAKGRNSVRVWAINAFVDRHGNRIAYKYASNGEGAFYPIEIRYTFRSDTAPDTGRLVEILYDDRQDVLRYFIGGCPITETRRITAIRTSIATPGAVEAVSTYRVVYGESLATKLSRVDAVDRLPGTATTGLRLAEFTWSDTKEPGFSLSSPTSSMGSPGLERVFPADVTGDGRTDIIHIRSKADGLSVTAYLAEVHSGEVSFSTGRVSALGHFGSTFEILPADVDGDGRTDIIVAHKTRGGTLGLAVFLATPTGFVPAASPIVDTGDPWDLERALPFFAADVNGDGRTDLVKAYNDKGKLAFRTYLSRFGEGSQGFAPAILSPPMGDPALPSDLIAFWAMDVNGDAMIDLVRAWRNASGEVCLTSYISVHSGGSPGAVMFSASKPTNIGPISTAAGSFMPVDVNGDGVQDLLQIREEPSGRKLLMTAWLCDAAGGFVEGPISEFTDQRIDLKRLYPMGLLGGGQVSLVCPWWDAKDQLRMSIFQGSPSGRFRQLADTAPVAASKASTFVVGDFDGNGKADFVRIYPDRDGIPQIQPWISSGPYNDQIETAHNAIGGEITVRYLPISDPAVYGESRETLAYPSMPARRYPHPLTPAQFPVQAVIGEALYVVASLQRRARTSDTAFGYLDKYVYAYRDALIDLSGRGWQGFRTMEATRIPTGRVEAITFLQSFPLTGSMAEIRAEGDGQYSTDPRIPKGRRVLLGRTELTYATSKRGQIVQVQPRDRRTTSYDYGAEFLDRQHLERAICDDYGNVTCHIDFGYVKPGTDQPLADDEVVYRHASFDNAPGGAWIFGLPLFTKVSANGADTAIDRFLPGDLTLTKRSYTPKTFDLLSVGEWDDQHDGFLTTTYRYDAIGNRISETKPGGSTTSFGYDATGTFETQVTLPANAQGLALVTEKGFDPRFGTEVARRTPNGAFSVVALDGYGRTVAKQGSLPHDRVSADSSLLTRLVAASPGQATVFLATAVVTLESSAYLAKDDAYYSESRRLQAFPTGQDRDFVWARSFVDGRGRERVVSQESGQTSGDVFQVTAFTGDQPTSHSLPFFAKSFEGGPPAHSVVTSYDVLGRPLSIRTPMGEDGTATTETTYSYGLGGKVTEVQAAGVHGVAYEQVREHHRYNGHDRVRRTVSGSSGAVATFAYDRLGRLLSSTDPATPSNPQGVTNATTYDSLGRTVTIDDPDRNTTGKAGVHALSYSYDPTTGELLMKTDAAGAVTTYAHDALGRVTRKAFGDGTRVDFTYDQESVPFGLGHVTRAERIAADGTLGSRKVFGYDVYGNATAVELTVAGEAASFRTTSIYDPCKRPVRLTFPDGSVVTRRFEKGKLVDLSLSNMPGEAQNPAASFPLAHYAATGQPGRAIYGQGGVDGGCAAIHYRYSPTGQPAHEVMIGEAGVLLDERYAFDALGQLLTVTPGPGTDGAKAYRYLDRRLIAATVPGFDGTASYAYDDAGDLTHKDGVVYGFRAHFADVGHKDGDVVYAATADACGRTVRRTSGGVTQGFAYDALGQLEIVSAEDGAVLSRMLNDEAGQKLRQVDADETVTVFVGGGYDLRRGPDGTVTITRVLAGPLGPVASVATGGAAAETRFLRCDHKGSVTHALDPRGVLQMLLSYRGYGERAVLKGLAPLRTYENKTWEAAAGLYYFEARYYDPASGRFLTPDDRLGDRNMLRAGAFNRYMFELGNPIFYVDPSGHVNWGKVIGIAVGVGIVIAGTILIVATAGAATPIVAGVTWAMVGSVVGSALVGGGMSAATYSFSNEDPTLEGWGKSFLIGAAVGAVTAGGSLGTGAAANMFRASVYAARARLLGYVGSGIIAGVANMGSHVATDEWVEGRGVKFSSFRDFRYFGELGLAFVTGFGLGFLSEVGGGVVDGIMQRNLPKLKADRDLEFGVLNLVEDHANTLFSSGSITGGNLSHISQAIQGRSVLFANEIKTIKNWANRPIAVMAGVGINQIAMGLSESYIFDYGKSHYDLD